MCKLEILELAYMKMKGLFNQLLRMMFIRNTACFQHGKHLFCPECTCIYVNMWHVITYDYYKLKHTGK